MTQHALIHEIKKLPPEQRLELIDEIYDSLDDEAAPLTPEQEAELDRRVAAYKDKPEMWIPLEQVEREIDELLKRK